jgi:hydroxymethylbilane synthase
MDPRVSPATRQSRLALWQAEFVKASLERRHPGLDVTISGMTTQGDRILDVSLSKAGGKGLFVKELEVALLEERADLAVHSLKDVPMALAPGLMLGAVMAREDARDAFISNAYAALDDLPDGAVVGTSSLRREAQIRAAYPRVRIEPLRGNVNTRLAKLDAGHYDAIILAAAGMIRLGMPERIRAFIEPACSLPAPGQGALGIEIAAARADLVALLAPLHDPHTALATFAERAVSRALGGNCTMPLGAHATWDGSRLALRAVLGKPDGTLLLSASGDEILSPDANDAVLRAEALGARVGAALIAQGGLALVADGSAAT